MNHGYERSLLFVLRHRFSAPLVLAFGLLGASVWLFMGMPKGFLPSVDSGNINGMSIAGQDISFDSFSAGARQGDQEHHPARSQRRRRVCLRQRWQLG